MVKNPVQQHRKRLITYLYNTHLTVHTGSARNGQLHGAGKVEYSSAGPGKGGVFEGVFSEGRIESGSGVWVLGDDSVYTGECCVIKYLIV